MLKLLSTTFALFLTSNIVSAQIDPVQPLGCYHLDGHPPWGTGTPNIANGEICAFCSTKCGLHFLSKHRRLREYLVNVFDDCIGNCFSNNWIITQVSPIPIIPPNPSGQTNQLICKCGGSFQFAPYNKNSGVECDNLPTNNYRVYRYFGLDPSQISIKKKRLLNQNSISISNDHHLCPDGLTACNLLDGDGVSYECIDTNTELESCGGCLNGQFMPKDHGKKGSSRRYGQDCTAIPGVNPSSVTCSAGQCKIYGCDHGARFSLKGDSCVPDRA
ncbi:uncharacterized protein L201_005204 [Kwoniella dendrophila CBS 6074]|uniref:Protein CPL1-like domain-containing protein n=1 Tax=Kwoniella dendrophila CBS 6074 TaxID=1295534 RepID=A0AAX4JXY5_9TREE